MAAMSDDEIELDSLLQDFDLICQDHGGAVAEIQSLKSSLDSEMNIREALEIACDDLRIDNERLRKLSIESLAKLANQFERHTKCQNLKKELDEANKMILRIKDEHAKENEMIRWEHRQMIEELQKQLSCCQQKQSVNEATIDALNRDLASRKAQIDILNDHMKQVTADAELKYHREIQDLRDWLTVEQEEKNVLHRRLLTAENELVIIKAKQAEQQQESISIRHVETLKQKVMKLRQENETLKRQLDTS